MHRDVIRFDPTNPPNIPWDESPRYGLIPAAVEIEAKQIKARLSAGAWDRLLTTIESVAPLAAKVLIVKMCLDVVRDLADGE